MPSKAAAPEGCSFTPLAHYLYSLGGRAKGQQMSETGLQKLAFFLLVALMLYVSVTGGGA